MAETGSTETFDFLLLREKVLTGEVAKTRAAIEQGKVRQDIVGHVEAIGASRDVSAIMSSERRLLENDLTEHTNSAAQRSSLKQALEDLNGAEKTLPLVSDPARYADVDASHSHRKSRTGGVPNDAARQFFSGNRTRLLNMDKARLSEEEKLIIQARRENMRVAEKVYSAMQRQALGLPAPDKDRGRDQGLAR